MFDVNGIVYASFMVLLRSMFWQYDNDEKKVIDFANREVKNCMLSFGETLHSGGNIKNITKSVKKIRKDYDYVRQYFNNNMFIDSGGFQIQMELIEPEHIPCLIEGYCDFIHNIPHNNTYYFIEDVIPTQNGKVNRQQAFDNTILGMKEMSKLSEEKRKNIYFVYHFQSPTIFDLWQDVMKAVPPEEYLGGHRWAVGGIVSNSGTSTDTSFISYMIPMQDILQREMTYLKQGKPMYFHILGVTGFLDIFFFTLFEALLKKYEMNVSITFDSTSSIMSVCLGNGFTFWENDPVPGFYTADLRPKQAHKGVKHFHHLNEYMTNEKIIQSKIKEMQTKFGMTGIDTHVGENGRMVTATQYVFMLYQMLSFRNMHKWCQEESKKLMEIFYTDKREFGIELVNTASHLRAGKMTKDSKNKCSAIFNTIEAFDKILSHNGNGNYKSLDAIRNQINTLLQSFESKEVLTDNTW